MTYKRRLKKKNKKYLHSSPKSSVGSCPYPQERQQEMGRWEEHLDYNETQFAKLLHDVLMDVHTTAGKKFDKTFWMGFTEELNNRIRPVNDMYFTVTEIVDHGRLLRDKWNSYKNYSNQAFSDEMKTLLEIIFPKGSLVKFPSKINSSGSCSRITNSGSTSRSRSRARTVDACESPIGGFLTSTVAHEFLMQLFKIKSLTVSELQIGVVVLDRDLALMRAFIAIETEEERRAFAKELKNRSL